MFTIDTNKVATAIKRMMSTIMVVVLTNFGVLVF
jgi:hypothetical protein